MENIVTQTLAEIEKALLDHGVVMDSWRSDAIQLILVLAFNQNFMNGVGPPGIHIHAVV